MKKTYTKPEICFESFLMSTNIAGDCEKPFVNNATKGTCPVIGSGGITVFDGSLGGACFFAPEDFEGGAEDRYNGLCYHVPIEEATLFNS